MSFFASTTKVQKLESTSQTYGQLIFIEPKSGFSSETSQSSTTNVNILSTTGEGETDLETAKAQIAIAAANNNNTAIVLKSEESINVLNNIGSVSNTGPLIATVINSAIKTKDEIKNILSEAQKVDLSISLKSKESEKIELNTIKIPELRTKFIYQFWEQNESDIFLQEDPGKDPLLNETLKNVPKYVEMQWDAVEVNEELTDEELGSSEAKEALWLKQKAFQEPRGILGYINKNFKNSFDKSSKKFNLINLNESVKTEIVDIHRLDKAFDSISNEKTFSNTIQISINVNKNNKLFGVLFKGIFK